MREDFKETFQPVIESQDKVKESIDKEQNELIKQLQENQLALTEGLDKNRLAITQGFDKMDDVKKWDLLQLPGYEAIEDEKESESSEETEEEPEETEEEPILYKISYRDLNKLLDEDKYPDDDHKLLLMSQEDIENIFRRSPQDKIKNIRFNKKNKRSESTKY